jgi:nitrite reductase/ring-hydroxylating ferredoxin subunit/uncharacterized membrane protein
MRSSAHISGHPIHPILVGFPVAYLLGSACMDLLARSARRPEWSRTARHMNALGIGSALAAAVPGVIDYLFAVPPRSSARTRGTDHMIANVSALALFGASRLGRREQDDRASWWAIGTELAGAGLLGVAGWLGGTLVYRNQIAVDHRYANAGQWSTTVVKKPATADEWTDIGAANELKENQMKLVHLDGERIVVGRTQSGLVAFADRCTHKGGPLSDGALACGVVQCPWHGSQFDVRTGEVKEGPARGRIETYEIAEVQERIKLRA